MRKSWRGSYSELFNNCQKVEPLELEGSLPDLYGHSATQLDCVLVIFGGLQYGRENPLSNLYRIEGSVVSEAKTNTPPIGRYLHSALYHESLECIFIFGGLDSISAMNDLWKFDIKTSIWTHVHASGETPGYRGGHSCVMYSDQMIVFGGFDGKKSFYNDMYSYDFVHKKWSKLINENVFDEIPSKRYKHSACIIGNSSMYVFGGETRYDTLTTRKYLNDLIEYDFSTKSWIKVKKTIGKAPSRRSGHSMCVTSGGRILIFGGYNGTNYQNDLYHFRTDTFEWKEIDVLHGTLPSKRTLASMSFADETLTLYGGFDGRLSLGDSYKFIFEKPKNMSFIAALYGSNKFSDICIVLEEGEEEVFHLHKCILSQSPILLKLMDHREVMYLKGIQSPVLRNVLLFLYNDIDSIVLNEEKMLMDLLEAATRFLITDLEAFCLAKFSNIINTNNFSKILQYAYDSGNDRLKNECLVYYQKRKDFITLDSETVTHADKFMLEFVLNGPKKTQIVGSQGRLYEHVKELYKTKEFADCTFIASDEETFDIHRAILGLTCEFFQNMLMCDYRESRETSIRFDIEGKTLECVIEFIYLGKVRAGLHWMTLLTSINLARQWMIKTMETEFTLEILKQIRRDNALEIAQMCVVLRVEGRVPRRCWQLIKSSSTGNLTECIIQTQFIHNLELEKTQNKMVELEKSNDNLQDNVRDLKSIIEKMDRRLTFLEQDAVKKNSELQEYQSITLQCLSTLKRYEEKEKSRIDSDQLARTHLLDNKPGPFVRKSDEIVDHDDDEEDSVPLQTNIDNNSAPMTPEFPASPKSPHFKRGSQIPDYLLRQRQKLEEGRIPSIPKESVKKETIPEYLVKQRQKVDQEGLVLSSDIIKRSLEMIEKEPKEEK